MPGQIAFKEVITLFPSLVVSASTVGQLTLIGENDQLRKSVIVSIQVTPKEINGLKDAITIAEARKIRLQLRNKKNQIIADFPLYSLLSNTVVGQKNELKSMLLHDIEPLNCYLIPLETLALNPSIVQLDFFLRDK